MKRGINSANLVIARDMTLRDVYIATFDKISVKFSVFGVLYPYLCTDGGEISHGLLHALQSTPLCQISSHWWVQYVTRGAKNLKTAL